jgi:putative hemolysin
MNILIIFFLIFINGFFSLAEIALVSSRKNRLRQLITDGNIKAKIALSMSEKPSFFLSTVQICITLIGVMMGAIGEGSIVSRISDALYFIPLISPLHTQLAFILVIGGITYLSIIFGELVPKRIALSNPEKFASIVSPIMQTISNIAYPIVRFLSFSTESIFKILGIKQIIHPPITEEEIRVLIREGTNSGIFNKTEKKLVERALILDDLKVNMLITPRNKIQWFDLTSFIGNPHEHLVNYHHSRILFAEDTVDKIIGVTHVKDLLKLYLLNKHADLRNILIKPLLIPENTRTLKLLEMFRHSPIHIALAIDEFGSVQGLITLNDVLEALIGDIQTQNTNDPQIVTRDDGSYLLDGMLVISELKKILKVDKLPKEDMGGFQTSGGFAISFLDKIPKSGDTFEWDNYRFEIVDMDDKRVDKILIKKIKK